MTARRAVYLAVLGVLHFSAGARADEAARTGAAKVHEGNKLLTDGKFSEALAAYDEAKSALPESAEVAYDRGIALYRLGEFEKAAKTLQDALKPDRPELEQKAKYNLGRCAHEAAIAKKDKIEEAMNDLSKAISFYKEAIGLNDKDPDPKLNLEQAERLRAFLEKKLKERKEQEKKNPSSQPTSQAKDEPSSQPNQKQQPSSQPSSQPEQQKDEQKQDQNDNDKKGDEEKKDQQKDQTGEQKDQNKGKQGKQSEKQDGSDEKKDDTQAQGGDTDKDQKMKPEDAEPMLQEARDAERARREARRAKMMRLRGRIPVAKDW